LTHWINSQRGFLDSLEIVAEEFQSAGEKLLHDLAHSYSLTVRAAQASIGTPGPLRETLFRTLAAIVAQSHPAFITAALGFSRSEEAELGIPIPVCPGAESLDVLTNHAFELLERLRTPLLFENIPSHLRVTGRISETEFIGRLCDSTGCGVVLDVTSVLVNARNHDFDPLAWIREIDPHRIVQLHVAGYSYRNGRWHDEHRENVQTDVWDLVRQVVGYARPESITLERYRNFISATEFENEMILLRSVVEATSSPS
jgi:uncharacterized protein (UPF0276 family)